MNQRETSRQLWLVIWAVLLLALFGAPALAVLATIIKAI